MSTKLQKWVYKFTALSHCHTEVCVCNAFADRKTRKWKMAKNTGIEGSFISSLFSICLHDFQQELQLPKATVHFYSRESKLRQPPILTKNQKKYQNLSFSWYSNTALILAAKSKSKNTSNISQNCVSEVKFFRSKSKQLF